MDQVAIYFYQIGFSFGLFILVSLGLAVIFGMMRVINFAHGEFLMMGGYTVILSTHAGINRWVSMLVLAPLVVGLVGMLVEWLIIRHLYGRVIETVLATWGLSLFLMGLATVTVGFYQEGILPPFGPVRIGAYKEGGYTFFVIGVTALILIGVYALMRYTWFGLIARGTMQNADMAAALGTDTRKVYALTFGFGAALSGLAGAIMAPISGVVPVVGMTYIAKAFITVISGGATVLAGTVSAASLLGLVNQAVTFVTTPVIGEVALLASAIVLLRILPTGITGRFFRRGL